MRKNKDTEIRVVTCFDGNRDAVDVFADIIASRHRRAMNLSKRTGHKEERITNMEAAEDGNGSDHGAYPIGQDRPELKSSDNPHGEKSPEKSENSVAIGRKKEYNGDEATDPGTAGSGGHHPQASRPCG